jgi:hypothetical protein
MIKPATACKIAAAIFLIFTAGALLMRNTARADNAIPDFSDRFVFVHPGSAWDGGRRLTVINDIRNPIHNGDEMFVLRGDDVVGIFRATSGGILNTYGDFFSHIRNFNPAVTDYVAVPKPGGQPPHSPVASQALVLFDSQAPAGRLWVVVDRGAKDGFKTGAVGAALLRGRKIGDFTILAAGDNISYGLLEREAIVSLSEIANVIVDLPVKNGDKDKPAK